jgi:hypothetical protein
MGQTQYPAQSPAAADPNMQQPPPPGQYPPPQGQYPPAGQYPPGQGQYPPQQGQYPPAGQYPPPQQYPQPAAGQYPSQYPPPQYAAPAPLPPQRLEQLAQPIALYPDGLLAQVLTASTFANQIPDAAAWANQHQFLHGDALARAIQDDRLIFDPSVMALIPFPSVLNYMAQYMGWTQELGGAVLTQRPEVMDAVQRLRQEAYQYGYLQTGPYQRVLVEGPGAIEILPVTPGYYYVPYYNPVVVFARPRPGFFVGGAIRFGAGITLGAAFAPWGWGNVGFGWHEHTILIDNRPWDRTWGNRGAYVHPYAAPYHPVGGPRVEHHEYHDHDHDHHH